MARAYKKDDSSLELTYGNKYMTEILERKIQIALNNCSVYLHHCLQKFIVQPEKACHT